MSESLRTRQIAPHAKVLVLQLALPHYRQGLVATLSDEPGLVFATGDSQFLPGVTVGVSGPNVLKLPPNRFLFNRKLAYQITRGVKPLSADVLVVELNPRILNSWWFLLVRRLLRKETWAWGHVFPRTGAGARTDKIRGLMRSQLDGMIVYTPNEARSFSELHPGVPVRVAANAIYSSEELRSGPETESRTDFIVIGRLVENKKPCLALEAFERVEAEIPEARLVFIGEGQERAKLEERGERLIEEGRLLILGEQTELATLRKWFSHGVAMVSPGYVGLNVTQALGFGVPVLFAEGESHAPEVEVLDTTNSVSFPANDVEALAAVMRQAWVNRDSVRILGPTWSEQIRSTYSVESMAEAFRGLIHGENSFASDLGR